MFDKNYKNAMDNITPSADVKEKILDRITLKEEVLKHKNPAIVWRVAFACVTCIAIVLGVLFIPKTELTAEQVGRAPQQLTTAKTYDDIYKIIESKKSASNGCDWFYYAVEEGTIVNAGSDDLENMEVPESSKPTGIASGDKSAGISKNEVNKKEDFYGTTEQVEGVAEADVIKTDGKYIYHLNRNYEKQKVNIFSADRENSALIGQIDLNSNSDRCEEMFLKENKLIILQTSYNTASYAKSKLKYDKNNYVSLLIYDISDPKNPKKVSTISQQGSYNSARMIGDKIYIISNCDINLNYIEKEKPESFVPTTIVNDVMKPVAAEQIYRYEDDLLEMPQYAVIGSYDCKNGTLVDSSSILGGTHQIYCSQKNIILTKTVYHDIYESENNSTSSTLVSRLEINDGQIEYKSSGKIAGTLENQFFIDEYKDYFRFVTTANKAKGETIKFENTTSEVINYSFETSATLTVLDANLKKVGEIVDLAPDEKVYSVRFMGDIAYFVTFRQVDPLFSADLSDPKNPKIIGKLKIPGFSEYLYPYGEGLLLGFGQNADEITGRTGDLKLSIFDIKDPANVTEKDMTLIDGYIHSEALYNHKDMLVSSSKNLIGFAANDNKGNMDYLIYKYGADKFERVAKLNIADNYNGYGTRGIFIKDGFYIINESKLDVYDLETFAVIKSIKL